MEWTQEQIDQSKEQAANQWRALKRLAREDHERRVEGKMTTCSRRACGAAMGGPAGGDACAAVQDIREFFDRLNVDSLPEHQRMWAGVLKAAFRF